MTLRGSLRGRVHNVRSRLDVPRRQGRAATRANRLPSEGRCACDATPRLRCRCVRMRPAAVRWKNAVAMQASAWCSRHHQRRPSAMRLAAETSERRAVVTQNFVGLVCEEATEDQSSAGRDDSLQMRGELYQSAAQNIGRDQIEMAMNRSERHRRESNRFFDSVKPCIGASVFQSCRIDIDCDHFGLALTTQESRRDCQDAGAGSGVENRFRRMRDDDRLKRAQSACCRWMVSGAKSLRWLDHDGRAAGLIRALPRWYDQDSASHAKWAEAFHPERGPSGINDSSRAAVDTAVSEHPGLRQREF